MHKSIIGCVNKKKDLHNLKIYIKTPGWSMFKFIFNWECLHNSETAVLDRNLSEGIPDFQINFRGYCLNTVYIYGINRHELMVAYIQYIYGVIIPYIYGIKSIKIIETHIW